jgi:hypothetical protein
VPTREFWALFKSVLQTNRPEGSARNLRFAPFISNILCFCRLRLNEFANSISFTESNLTKMNPDQDISQRLLVFLQGSFVVPMTWEASVSLESEIALTSAAGLLSGNRYGELEKRSRSLSESAIKSFIAFP